MSLFLSKLALLAALSIFPCLPFAENTWLYPDPNTIPSYNYLDTLNASWTTTFDSPRLILWCTDNGGVAYGPKYNETVPSIGYRLLPLNYSETVPYQCHFSIVAKENPGENGLNSGDFKIQIESSTSTVTWSPTNPTPSTSKTASAAAKTSSPAVSTSQALSPAASTSAPASATRENKSKSGLNAAAKAGIGLGAAAGVIALIAGLLLWLRDRRKWRQSQLAGYDESMQKQHGYQASELTASDIQAAPVETDGRMMDHDMLGKPLAQTMSVGELEGSGTTTNAIGTAR